MQTTRIVYKDDSILAYNGCEIVTSDDVLKISTDHGEGRLDFFKMTNGEDGVRRGRVIRSIALDQVASFQTLTEEELREDLERRQRGFQPGVVAGL